MSRLEAIGAGSSAPPPPPRSRPPRTRTTSRHSEHTPPLPSTNLEGLHEAALHVARLRRLDRRVDEPLPPADRVEPELGPMAQWPLEGVSGTGRRNRVCFVTVFGRCGSGGQTFLQFQQKYLLWNQNRVEAELGPGLTDDYSTAESQREGTIWEPKNPTFFIPLRSGKKYYYVVPSPGCLFYFRCPATYGLV